MADTTLTGKYYVKTTASGTYADVTTLVDGVRILEIKGMFDQGKTVNVYTAQWIDSQTEDFLITKEDSSHNPIVVRENPDISITFIVGNKYASNTIDVVTKHDLFVSTMTSKDVWVHSTYTGKVAHCMALESYSPTTTNLQRGGKSYIIGTIKLHVLETITNYSSEDQIGYEDPGDGDTQDS